MGDGNHPGNAWRVVVTHQYPAMRYHLDAALAPGFSLEEFGRAVESKGARRSGSIPRGTLQLEEHTWLTGDGHAGIRHVFDHFVDVAFVRAESDVVGRPAGILREFQAVLPLRYTGALLQLASSRDAAARGYAVRSLAVTTPRYGGDVYHAIRSALFDGEPHLRGSAMKAIARWPYVGFAAELDRLADTEADPDLRREAIRLADDLRKHGRRGLR